MSHSKTLLLLSIVLINNFFVQGQDIESMILKEREPSCEDISQSSSEFFAKYIASANLDSAQLILNYWKEKCGSSEPLVRANILFAMLNEQPISELVNDDMLWYLYNFMDRVAYDPEEMVNYYRTSSYFGYVTPNGYFDQVVTRRFYELSSTFGKGTEAYLLSNFYSLQIRFIFDEIQKSEYADSKLSKSYLAEVEEVKKMGEGHIAWITALWVPTGELKTMGVHPDIGFLAGWKKGKWNYDFVMTFKFLKAKNSYLAKRKSSNTIESSDHFFGGQIGFEVGRDIYIKGPHEIQLIGGLAMDGIDVLEEDESQNLDAQSIITYNLNVGLGYRRYTNGRFYFGLRAKYNVIDYTINNAIDLTGNAYSVQFVFGNVNNIFKSSRLKNLGQQIRQ